MKRFVTILLSLSMLLGMNTIAFASDDVKIKVNGDLLSDAQAVLKDGSTLLPVRSVGTALGGEIVWDNATKTASIDKDGTLVTITIGEKAISVNGTKQAISTPAQIIDGRTYVPLRALGEALECDITWVNETKTVEISQADAAEYKVWFESNDSGNLYIKSNINSQKWNGYSMLVIYNMKNKNNPHHSEFDTSSGNGLVTYKSTSLLSYPWTDEVSGVKSTEVYIFKGTGLREKLNYIDRSPNEKREQALAALSDKIVYQTTLDNKLTFTDTSDSISFTDFAITHNSADQKETYLASIENDISQKGQYGLYSKNGKKHRFTGLSIKNDILTGTREQDRHGIPGSTVTFYITHSYTSMDDKGNISVHRALSNPIDYKLPFYY